MRSADVAVIDYGVGNLRSVRAAFEHCGAQVQVTSAPEVILRAARVVLPGVGAFANGMSELRRRGLDEVAREVALRGVPLLGICLGMQMLLSVSEEFGLTKGLDLIRGRVVAMNTTDCDGHPLKIPHVGWNGLLPAVGRDGWRGSLLEDIRTGEAVYFLHSFTAQPEDPRHRIADCQYGGRAIPAVVACDNVSGCQFHPEKSGNVGLRVLCRFLTS